MRRQVSNFEYATLRNRIPVCVQRGLPYGDFASRHDVAYLLEARTAEPDKQPLLGNAHTQKYRNCHDTRCDAYSRYYGTSE
jgi:hypothetical protein